MKIIKSYTSRIFSVMGWFNMHKIASTFHAITCDSYILCYASCILISQVLPRAIALHECLPTGNYFIATMTIITMEQLLSRMAFFCYCYIEFALVTAFIHLFCTNSFVINKFVWSTYRYTYFKWYYKMLLFTVFCPYW